MLEERENKSFIERVELRAIRAVITSEDSFFIYLSRRDGHLRIAKGLLSRLKIGRSEWQ